MSFCKIIPRFQSLSLKLLKPSPQICQPQMIRNYWRHRDFTGLSSVIQSVENCMRDMDREIKRAFDEIQRSGTARPFISPWGRGQSQEIPVVTNTEDGRKYKLELNMEGMEPEDISITLNDTVLTVKARRENKRSGSFAVRDFSYSYTLPQDVKADTIRTSFSDGILTIEAYLPASESKEIPINVETGKKTNDQKKDNN